MKFVDLRGASLASRFTASLAVLLVITTAAASQSAAPLVLDTVDQWQAATGVSRGVSALASFPIGGRSDLVGNGALMLRKARPEILFWKQDDFVKDGVWTSVWREAEGLQSAAITTALQIYGQPQNMREGWVKFDGNPLVCDYEWRLASPQSLQLPPHLHDRGNDQSLDLGAGPFEGQWLLFFNIGGWAVKGWAMATAPSLEPLKRGENPFELYDTPYPLFEGTGGTHAPNDWVYADGTWYAPDETKGGPSHMWTATNLGDWQNAGEIVGLRGHDPGMVYDGAKFYLFNEIKNAITYCSAENPLGPWTDHGVVFETGSHTGDPDIVFFNNRWHMVYDDGPHLDYELGYAWTTPEEFPVGWRLERKFFGPKNPDQGQVWDEPTEDGNGFGTGDGDFALEGNTLYMVYERPVGLAYKELDVLNGDGVSARLRVEFDEDGDGQADVYGKWRRLTPGESRLEGLLSDIDAGTWARISIELSTEEPTRSPMITRLVVGE